MKLVWMRRLFQLSLLMLAVPVYMLYRQLQPGTSLAAEDRLLLDQAIGLWHVALVEQASGTPSSGAEHVLSREYELQICDDCVRTLKAAFISPERPVAADYGAIFSGGPTVFHSRLSYSGTPSPKAEIWLTLEGWNGDIWQVSIP